MGSTKVKKSKHAEAEPMQEPGKRKAQGASAIRAPDDVPTRRALAATKHRESRHAATGAANRSRKRATASAAPPPPRRESDPPPPNVRRVRRRSSPRRKRRSGETREAVEEEARGGPRRRRRARGEEEEKGGGNRPTARATATATRRPRTRRPRTRTRPPRTPTRRTPPRRRRRPRRNPTRRTRTRPPRTILCASPTLTSLERCARAWRRKGITSLYGIQAQTFQHGARREGPRRARAKTGLREDARVRAPDRGGDQPARHPVPRERSPRAGPQAAVVALLAPTRELAKQVHADFRRTSGAAFKLHGDLRVRRRAVRGAGARCCAPGCDIVVGTPGADEGPPGAQDARACDTLRFRVLDEADEMLNMGFVEDIETDPERTRRTTTKLADAADSARRCRSGSRTSRAGSFSAGHATVDLVGDEKQQGVRELGDAHAAARASGASARSWCAT